MCILKNINTWHWNTFDGTYTSLYLLKIIHYINYWWFFFRHAIIHCYNIHYNHVLIFMFPFWYDVDLKSWFLGSYSSWKLNLNRGNCRIFLSQQNLVYNRACHSVSVLFRCEDGKVEIASQTIRKFARKQRALFRRMYMIINCTHVLKFFF